VAYGAVGGLAHAVHFYRRFRERERRALLLESNLANARLDALRAQLQPHFLFNSLNAIAALLRRDPRLAEATLLSLSELLRLALRQSERQEIALREELEFVRRYLEIQQTRFGDRLRVEQDIEAAALDCAVPTLLLQPLVENAIRHGLEPDGNAGLVRLTARKQDGRLVLTVEDDGAGFATQAGGISDRKAIVLQAGPDSSPVAGSPPPGARHAARSGTGIGLTNLRARLETLYGTRQALELGPRPGGGVTVRIEIPWRSVTAAETLNTLNDL
jgi:LytS/YehU family sensor histidine kinase